MKLTFKKAVMGASIAAVMGGVPASASADVIDYSFNGLFTMVSGAGAVVDNASSSPEASWWYAHRTLISGTMQLDTSTGAGTGTVGAFHFNGDTDPFLANAHDITFQAVGDGQGGPGTLVLGNMGFDWNGTTGIPVSIVMDAAGLFNFNASPGFAVGSTIGCANTSTMVGNPASPGGAPCSTTGGATAATDGYVIKNKSGTVTFDGAMGTLPVATTTWNTTTLAGAGMGSNVSGTTPVIADAIGGSPMIAGPFAGFNANFDITEMTVTNLVVDGGGTPPPPTATPLPAAAWLLGSGLVGLVGVARRRKWHV